MYPWEHWLFLDSVFTSNFPTEHILLGYLNKKDMENVWVIV